MSLTCTRCQNSGFLNVEFLPLCLDMENLDGVVKYIENNEDTDVQVCDCCGDGEGWYGTPGEHYNSEDPVGPHGPYAGNGGLCQCH